MTRVAVRPLIDTDLNWTTIGVAPWPPSTPVLDLAIAALPLVDDPVIASLVEELATTISDQRCEIASLRQVLTVALDRAYEQHVTIVRLRDQLFDLRKGERK